jgi:hypothetical protein
MPNMQSRKTMNFQENIEGICRQWKVVKLNVVKLVNWFSNTRTKDGSVGAMIAIVQAVFG